MPTQHLTLTTTTDTLETITAMEAKQEIAIQPAMAAQAPMLPTAQVFASKLTRKTLL